MAASSTPPLWSSVLLAGVCLQPPPVWRCGVCLFLWWLKSISIFPTPGRSLPLLYRCTAQFIMHGPLTALAMVSVLLKIYIWIILDIYNLLATITSYLIIALPLMPQNNLCFVFIFFRALSVGPKVCFYNNGGANQKPVHNVFWCVSEGSSSRDVSVIG